MPFFIGSENRSPGQARRGNSNLVEVEELETEISQADMTKEKIVFSLMQIDKALQELQGAVNPVPLTARQVNPETPAIPNPPATVPTDQTPPTPDPPPTATLATPTLPRVKLPKLSIKRFGGEMMRWPTFWDSFESAVHSNPMLSNVDKFNYLKSYLESSAAAEAIVGFTLTSANYEEAVATLKKRFGNTQLIINKHMDGLLGLPSVSSHHDSRGLRHFIDRVETHIRGLRVAAESLWRTSDLHHNEQASRRNQACRWARAQRRDRGCGGSLEAGDARS